MKMNVRGNDCFQTPDDLYQQLDGIFNFTLDAACTTQNCKCGKGIYYDKGLNALEVSWAGERVFLNPPFSQKSAFIQKAYEEVMFGKCPICVMILPSNCMDCVAFHKYIYKQFFYEILAGRVAFIDPSTQKPMTGNNSGTVIVYLKKDIKRSL